MSTEATPFGLGLDLVDYEHLQRRLASRPELRQRLFTQAERAYADAKPEPVRHLAARFAAKEAAVKALGLDEFNPQEIEVADGGAEARLVVHGQAAEQVACRRLVLLLSMTHAETAAAAVVLALPAEIALAHRPSDALADGAEHAGRSDQAD